jgi:hypothetical protein
VEPLTPLSAKILAAPAALSAVSCRSRFCSVVETLAYPITAIGRPHILLIPNDLQLWDYRLLDGISRQPVSVSARGSWKPVGEWPACLVNRSLMRTMHCDIERIPLLHSMSRKPEDAN